MEEKEEEGRERWARAVLLPFVFLSSRALRLVLTVSGISFCSRKGMQRGFDDESESEKTMMDVAEKETE